MLAGCANTVDTALSVRRGGKVRRLCLVSPGQIRTKWGARVGTRANRDDGRFPQVVVAISAPVCLPAAEPRRHSVSGAKSDTGDAHVQDDLVPTDRHQLRPIAGDSVRAEAIKVLSRA